MVEVNSDAPSVKLKLVDQDRTNHDFELKDAYSKGSTVLYFFPAAFTGVCTKSSCELSNDLKQFSDMNTQIFGLSTDSPFTLKKFREENQLNYPLLSDWNREAIKAFEIVDDNFAGGLKGVAKRSLFAIKNGKITFQWIAETPGNYPPFEELKSHLAQ